MQPSENNDSNVDSISESDVESPFVPLGDFDTRRVKRKSNFDRKSVLIITGMISVTTLLVGAIVVMAFSRINNNHTKIDESKVQVDPALQLRKGKDDGMENYMEKLSQSQPPTEPAAVSAPPNLSTDVSKASQNQNSKSDGSGKSQQQPADRQSESLFGAVTRFDTGGFSAGSVGGNSGSGNGSFAGNDQGTENIRAMANAPLPTAESLQGSGDQGATLTGGSSSGGELGNLTATRYPTTKAYRAPNPKYLLKRRTTFQCGLYTGVRTDHPGYVTCILTRPIYSSDGSVILAEAGAELDGEQKVEVKAGQSTVFTSWTDLETYPGVRTSLNGLGADPLGQSGTSAYIDNHYGQRFGGAIMLSFMQDALQSVSNSTQKSGGGGYTVNNTEQNAQDMASKALENSINIPPTAYLLPGTVINVIVNQDIDFSSVFTTR
jgi:type IV secretion system protein VirB10